MFKNISISMTMALAASSAFASPIDRIEATPPIHVKPGATAGPAGYSPAQIRHAYGFDQVSGNGSGQTIAIVDAYGSPSIQHDLDNFCATFGIPSTTVQIAYPQGKPNRANGGWALETSLDVEWAHAVAPGATILLVVAVNNSLSDLLAAVDYAVAHGAQVVSMSWGSSEFSSESSYDTHFSATGVTFFASSGDNGAGVGWPAASARVIGVGGTTLPLDPSGNPTGAETAWSGSGGGQSAYIAEPSYQSASQSSGKRGVPDVAYDANPNTGVSVYDTTALNGQKGWFVVGGTSAGAPQWAALTALVNANRLAPLGANAANAIYHFGAPSTLTTYFYDVTSGCNSSTTSSLTCAAPGYDFVTGLGRPQAASLVPALETY